MVKKRTKPQNFIRKLIIVILWILIWQGAGLLIHNSILFATPAQTAKALWESASNVSFWRTVGMTLLRIGCGFLLGLAAGVILAALSKACPLLEEFLSPVIGLLKTVPVVCFVVLFLIWWGSSFLSIAISFLMVFAILYFSTLEGLKAVSRDMLEMAEVFRLPWRTRLFMIYRPALKPFLSGSMKTALGVAWKSGVAAEIIGLPSWSIGEKLYLSKISIDTAGIFAWTLVVCVLSYLFEKAVLALAGGFFSFRARCRAPKRYGREPGKIIVTNLQKSFGDQKVIRDLSMEICPGEVKWFHEPSGSGKTTLFRILTGLEKPDAGSVNGEGKGGYAVLFQEDRLCMGHAAWENVALANGNEKEARALLQAFLSPELLEKRCDELSGGERRRVALARALAAEGACLILDEPFAGLDQETAKKCWREILARKNGRTILVASHVILEEGTSEKTPEKL